MVAESKENNLKVLMQSKNMTAEGLSNELKISLSTVKRLMAGGSTDARLSSILPIAKFFGVSVEEVLGLTALRKSKALDGITNLNVRIPVLHWEQLENIQDLMKKLDPYNWDEWTDVNIPVSEEAFALRVTEGSLPSPFFQYSIIVIDPEHPVYDSNYVITKRSIDKVTQFEIMQYLTNGTVVSLRNIQSNRILPKNDNEQLLGTILFCKANLIGHEFLLSQQASEILA